MGSDLHFALAKVNVRPHQSEGLTPLTSIFSQPPSAARDLGVRRLGDQSCRPRSPRSLATLGMTALGSLQRKAQLLPIAEDDAATPKALLDEVDDSFLHHDDSRSARPIMFARDEEISCRITMSGRRAKEAHQTIDHHGAIGHFQRTTKRLGRDFHLGPRHAVRGVAETVNPRLEGTD